MILHSIEIERRIPGDGKPEAFKPQGTITYGECERQLKNAIRMLGYEQILDYAQLSWRLKGENPMPKDCQFEVKTDFGGSEGVYIDVSYSYVSAEDKRRHVSDFFTLKTLEQNDLDLTKMFHLACCVQQLLNGAGRPVDIPEYDAHYYSRYREYRSERDEGKLLADEVLGSEFEEFVERLDGILMESINTDVDGPESYRLLTLYNGAGDIGRWYIDQVMMSICGWTFHTLLKKAKEDK